jgi:hypothetical protein
VEAETTDLRRLTLNPLMYAALAFLLFISRGLGLENRILAFAKIDDRAELQAETIGQAGSP